MPRILVVYYSSYGHIEAMAYAQAEGAARVAKADVAVKRVPELVPPELCQASGFKLEQAAPFALPFGVAAAWSAKSAACSAVPPVSTAARKLPSLRSIRLCCITGW
jgi:hypothetical protein